MQRVSHKTPTLHQLIMTLRAEWELRPTHLTHAPCFLVRIIHLGDRYTLHGYDDYVCARFIERKWKMPGKKGRMFLDEFLSYVFALICSEVNVWFCCTLQVRGAARTAAILPSHFLLLIKERNTFHSADCSF